MTWAVAPGQVLDGKFRVERVLGRGGMGYVVEAFHLQLHERVALKFLLPEALAVPSLVERFHREARAAVRIKGENVCRVLDVRSSAEHGPYLVMELLVGDDLGRLVRRHGPLPWQDAVGYVLQACQALSEAHMRGIVHRDLKPSNLYLTARPDGTPLVKLLDFGISKVAWGSEGATELTGGSTSVLGSYSYMAPEQVRAAKDVDRRADVWALGCILQKLVTGRTPFVAETPSEYVAKIAADAPERLCTLRPDAPADLEAVVLRCLEKERGWRFATVAELALALVPLAPEHAALVEAIVRVGVSDPGVPPSRPDARPRTRAVSATPLGVTPLGRSNPSTAAAWSPSTPAKPPSHAQVGMAVLAGIAALTLGGILAVLWVGPRAPSNAESDPVATAPGAAPEPTPTQPEPAQPEPAQPEPAQPEPAQSGSAQSGSAEPHSAEPHSAGPEPQPKHVGATLPKASASTPTKAPRPTTPKAGGDPFSYQ